MAHSSRVSALTDELIHSILKFDPEANRQAYKRAKETASRGLRAHQFARVNQFDVHSSFTGLDEKFRVLNRDDLADALDKRVKEIYQEQHKWVPDYLQLLLLLSDQPTENSKIEALELLRPPTPPSPLTWKQILEDDPYSDDEIWKDVDFRGSSDDEYDDEPLKRKKGKDTPRTSLDGDDTFDAETCVVPDEVKDDVKELEKGQFWTKVKPGHDEKRAEITELQAVRETLFMLAGLPTSLYHLDAQTGSIRVSQKYVLGHAMQRTADHLLVELADMGRELNRLRQWVKRSSSLPLVQTFESAVRTRLAEYDRSLALLQQKYLVPETPVAISLLEVHDQLRKDSRPILRLAQLVQEIEPQLLVNPFIHLETLFDQTTLAQQTLEKSLFDFLSLTFFECLQTYLKPIRRWMESGELGLNDETFFIFENDSGSEVSSLWHDRFVLRRGQENKLRSPSFLQPAAQKIFNTGKSVVFLKELNIYKEGQSTLDTEPRLDHPTVCGNTSSEVPLSPFPELFQAAFQTWIGSKYSLASANLREYLFSGCGLMRTLDEFKTLYLSADGSLFQDFADAIFDRMDSGGQGWNDRFLLTELARGIFSAAFTRQRAERVVVRSVREKERGKGRNVGRLAELSLDYALPWPIQNIIQRTSIPIYQSVFTFLLQTYRTKYLVQRVSPQQIRQVSSPHLRQLAYKLRQRLIWFSDILRSYLTETVIDRASEDMKAAMIKAEDIDDMADIHMRFVARLQDQALLSDNLRPICKAIVAILDLGVVFSEGCFPPPSTTSSPKRITTASAPSISKSKSRPTLKSKASRRKSFIPAIAENLNDSSDSEAEDKDKEEKDGDGSEKAGVGDFEDSLKLVESEFERLLPFVTAGLRNVGRVGAEPCWEGLAERLSWGEKKEA